MLTARQLFWINLMLGSSKSAILCRHATETLMPDTPATLDAFLGGRLTIAQPARGYRAGLDAVLLAATVAADGEASATVLDVGAGVGTVGLCVAARIAGTRITLLEAQPDLSDLAAQNILRNQLQQRVRVITADVYDNPASLRALGLDADTFDHVVCNPPFDIEGHGRRPPNASKARSHVMPVGALEQWARVLARYCRNGGTLTIVHRADALGAVLAALEGRFGGLRVLPVHPRAGEAANRILVRGTKASRAPLTVLAGLVLHAAAEHGCDGASGANDHRFAGSVQAILRDGAALTL
jgi:tRNA1(Val) A37 N6-methylase TrmN6